jgi:hypothetical protein
MNKENLEKEAITLVLKLTYSSFEGKNNYF